MFESQRVRCCNRDSDSSFDHTMVDTPHPIRTAKLSTIGPDQYCGGGPRGNLGCRTFFVLPRTNLFFLSKTLHAPTPTTIRSNHNGYTASHPNCEVKHCWAQSVLRWGTTRESWVLNVFFFFHGKKQKDASNFFPPKISHPFPAPAERTSHRLKKKRKTNRQTKAKSHAIVTTR